MSLPLVEVKPGEEEEGEVEVEVFKRWAKLYSTGRFLMTRVCVYFPVSHPQSSFVYRYAIECNPPEWKERDTGDVRIMKKEEGKSARILMRREKTLKVCANHHITPWMDMRPNCGNKKAWVWKTQADFADEEPKQEVMLPFLEKTPTFCMYILQTLSIKFGNEANSEKFFEAFEEMRKYVLKMEAKKIQEE